MGGVLEGIVVLDLSRDVAGAITTRLLAEAGATVVLVEPQAGHRLRTHPGFATWGRGKRSVILDWAVVDEDRDRLLELLDQADVLVHDRTRSEARRLPVAPSRLAETHPTLVEARVPAYPHEHPDGDRPGDDLTVQARMGMSDVQACARPGPTYLRLPAATWGAAYLLAAGVLARLWHRRTTGHGGVAETSLLQGALSHLTLLWNRAEAPSARMAQKLPMPRRPATNFFLCADHRWIFTAAGYWDVPLVIETLAALGLEPPPAEVDPGPEFAAVYQQAFETRPSKEWLDALWASDVASQLVASLGDLLRDVQAIEGGYTVEIDDPVWGRCRQAGLPFHMIPPLEIRGPAPRVGQHQHDPLGPASRPAASALPPAAVPTPASHDDGPLSGLRVLDVGMFVGGPFGPTLLAELGADVIKLEPPSGDRMRLDELLFISASRGKRSVSVDLKTPRGREVLERLLLWADVVHHNLRSAAAERLGVNAAAVQAVNPRAIHCHVSAFGTKGPKAGQPSYDPQMQAAAGWMEASAGEGNRPLWLRFAPTDVQAAELSVVATLLGLLHRETTGEGTTAEVSMLGGAVATTSETLLQLTDDRLAPLARLTSDVTGTRLGHRLFEASDGWVAVSIDPDAEERILRALGAHNEPQAAGAAAGYSSRELVNCLRGVGALAERVRTNMESTLFDDSAWATFVVRGHHPRYGQLDQLGRFWSFGDKLPVHATHSPPTLGRDTRSVLLELGYSEHELLELAGAGAVFGDAVT